MGVYNGTGYFIEHDALSTLKISEVMSSFKTIDSLLLKPLHPHDAAVLMEKDSLLSLLKAHSLVTDEPLYHYGCRVCFVGAFEKYFDEADIELDSGDYERVEELLDSDGFDYAVSNVSETDHILEMLTAILKNFNILTDFDILESYWFIMPYPLES